jgi:transcriptional regulator with XRE-family HTH domain
MFDQKKFAERFKQLRIQKGFSQTGLGKYLGVSKQAISDIERGRRTTTIEKLVEIADLFETDINYLCGRIDSPAIHSPVTPTSEDAAAIERAM